MTENNVPEKKSREKKTSKEQYEIYCSFLEQHKEMAVKKDSDHNVQQLWEELVKLLNCASSGPSKNKRMWQKTFENWRNSVRHKKRQEEYYRNGTGGGPEKPSELKDIEHRALALWGKVVLTGVSKTNAEFGFGQPPPCNMEATFLAELQLHVAEGVEIEESLIISERMVNYATPLAENTASVNVTHELSIPEVIPTSSSSQAPRKRKRKVQAPKDAQLSDLLANIQNKNSAAILEINKQLERLVEVKEAEVKLKEAEVEEMRNF